MLDIIISLVFIQRKNIEANPLVVVLNYLDKYPKFCAFFRAEGLSSDLMTLNFLNESLYWSCKGT